jgi:hypothetical protein
MGKLLNLTGKTFGRLTVVRRIANDKQGACWRCLCECGNKVSVRSASLVHNRTKSCGCIHRESVRKQPFYHLFASIKRRERSVINPERKKCHLTFSQFLTFTTVDSCHYCGNPVQWSPFTKRGYRQYNLDRKNNHKGYSVANCVVCCSRCNKMKGTLDYKDFFDFTAPIRKNKL